MSSNIYVNRPNQEGNNDNPEFVNQKKDKNNKKKGNGWKWAVTVVMALFSLSEFSIGGVTSGILFLLGAVVTVPILHDLLKKNGIEIKNKIIIPSCICLFVFACAFAPDTSDELNENRVEVAEESEPDISDEVVIATPSVTPEEKAEPTVQPTPTAIPTVEPTSEPTPTAVPTVAPTKAPTPTAVPTVEPTKEPTPVAIPTIEPTKEPTVAPINQSDSVNNGGNNSANIVQTPVAPANNNNASVAQPPVSGGGYICNKKNHEVIHRPNCSRLPKPENREYFATLEEAYAAGYSNPHDQCMY